MSYRNRVMSDNATPNQEAVTQITSSTILTSAKMYFVPRAKLLKTNQTYFLISPG